MSFHFLKYAGYFPTDDPLYSSLERQHQHSPVLIPSGYLPYNYCCGNYENCAQLPAPLILLSSSSSKLSHALVETPLPESQPIDHVAIALPTIYMLSLSVPTHELSETLVGVVV